jgi:hypothetical protein
LQSDVNQSPTLENAANIIVTRFSAFSEVHGMNRGTAPGGSEDFFFRTPAWALIREAQPHEANVSPTPQKRRSSVYLALMSGYSGILYQTKSSNGNFSDYPLVYTDCALLAEELAELTPAFTAPYHVPPVTSDVPAVVCRAWNELGMVTVVAVNLNDQPAGFRAGIENSTISGIADLMFENRTLNMENGAVTDMIDGYGTRIWRFDARQKTGKAENADQDNLLSDPGFEKTAGLGIFSACTDGSRLNGNFVIDSRRHYEGGHSLRMNNPGTKTGKRLCFDVPALEAGRGYTVSVMARSGGSTNAPAGKNGGIVKFRLGLGNSEAVFECTDTWKKYEINVVVAGEKDEPEGNPIPWIEMAGKGTVWFDSISLQVQP